MSYANSMSIKAGMEIQLINCTGDCPATFTAVTLRITCRFVILSLIAVARGLEILWEQPSGSLMPEFPYLKFMAIVIDPVLWGKVRLFQAQSMVCTRTFHFLVSFLHD